MKKLLKVFLMLSIVLSFFMNFSVLATDSEKAADANTNTTATTTSTTSDSNSSKKDSSATVTPQAQLDNEGLQLTDMLNILLIATGVVIILLAIAILIKLK